jgi:hypothetical protein
MNKRKTNLVDMFAEHPSLNQDERELLKNLAYLDPRIMYHGHDEFRKGQVMRIYFAIGKSANIKSKEELEKKLVSDSIISKNGNIKLNKTIKNTKYGEMYFLHSKEVGPLAIYFIKQ